MPSILLQPSIGAGLAVNILAGTQYEFAPFHAHVEFGLCTALTGLLATIYAGTDLLLQEGPVDLKALNQMPIYPDNFHVNDDVAFNDRLNVTVRNTTGSAAIVMAVIRLNPL